MKKISLSFATLLAIFLIPSVTFAIIPTKEQISQYEKKMMAHRKDLIEICKNLNRDDAEIAINLINLANEYSIKLEYIKDIILIRSLISNKTDKAQIEPIVIKIVTMFVSGIEISISEVNLAISHLQSRAILSTATELRSDLRALQSLLEKSP